MNNSNHSLRFSRSYTEATGKRLRSTDFVAPEPIVTVREAVFWASAIGIIIVTVYLLKGF